MFRFPSILLLILFFFCTGLSCKSQKKNERFRSSAERGPFVVIKGDTLNVEIAATPERRRLGLMFCDTLGENQGMLFVFSEEKQLSFWMKNTPIPLSIAFIDKNGTIVDIKDMQPLDTTVYHSKRKAMYALEVNQGWFRERGIHVGDTVVFFWQKIRSTTPSTE